MAPAFSKELSADYNLHLHLSLQKLTYAVFDENKGIALYIGEEKFENVFNFFYLKDILQKTFEKSEYLNLTYNKVKLTVSTNKSTLVPYELYREGHERDYLSFQNFINLKENMLVDDVKIIEAKNIYALEKSMDALLREHFKNINVYHAATVLLQNINSEGITMYIQPQALELFYMKDNKLMFYNSFKCKAPEDYLYYVISLYKEFNLDTKKEPLYILGANNDNAETEGLLEAYIKNVYRDRKDYKAIVSDYDVPVPLHSYKMLFDLQQCE